MTDFQDHETPIEKPTVLKVLVVLSCINQGLTILFLSLIKLVEKGAYNVIENADLTGEEYESSIRALDYMSSIALPNILFNIISLYGVVTMWKLKRQGWHIYIGGQAGLLISSMMVSGISFGDHMWEIFFTISFVMMYHVALNRAEQEMGNSDIGENRLN